MGDEKNKILKRLAQMKPQFETKFHLKSLALFGSFARGDFTPDSDIDIMVEFFTSPGMEFIDLVNELEVSLGRRVDLVSKKAIQPHYLQVIQQELIYV